jgi:hypothetical protein
VEIQTCRSEDFEFFAPRSDQWDSASETDDPQLLAFIGKKGFQTPVTFVSAHVDEEVEKRMRALGINSIL